MTIDEFNQLPHVQQVNNAVTGVFLASRSGDTLTVNLFAVHEFYVELYYEPQHKLAVYVYAFDSTTKLVPYLNNIVIDDLFYR